jgi:GNAT superfamily N-acetyltransferase
MKDLREFAVRAATLDDLPALNELISASVRALSEGDYTTAQMDGAIGSVLGVDTQLIQDGTYFIWETATKGDALRVVGSGGWSYRKTLCGADNAPNRNPEAMDPATDAAKIRAIFVHPEFARCGLGSRILTHVEGAARAAGFRRAEMGSTMTGYPMYLMKGYVETSRSVISLENGEALPIVQMTKAL